MFADHWNLERNTVHSQHGNLKEDWILNVLKSANKLLTDMTHDSAVVAFTNYDPQILRSMHSHQSFIQNCPQLLLHYHFQEFKGLADYYNLYMAGIKYI